MGKLTVMVLSIFTVALTQSCPKLMAEAGLNEWFPMVVAHRMHSLTWEDLKYYFREDVPVKNGIPTVNEDLTPNTERILMDAPVSGYDMDFETMALKHTDRVLSHMDTKDWQIRHYSVLEKMVHAHHMAELWQQSQTHYNQFVEKPPTEEVCNCVTNINENFVMAELQLLALKIKFPGVTSGDPDLFYSWYNAKEESASKPYYSLSYSLSYKLSYSLSFSLAPKEKKLLIQKRMAWLEKLKKFNFEGEDDDVVERALEELVDWDRGLSVQLTNEDGWKEWREGFKEMNNDDNRLFGMFMYCMLNSRHF